MYPMNWPFAEFLGRQGVPLVIKIQVQFDNEANVFTATSSTVKGLVVESDSLHGVLEEIELVLPDLLRLKNQNKQLPPAYLKINTAFHPA